MSPASRVPNIVKILAINDRTMRQIQMRLDAVRVLDAKHCSLTETSRTIAAFARQMMRVVHQGRERATAMPRISLGYLPETAQ